MAGLARIERLHVWGEPDRWAVAYGAEEADLAASVAAVGAGAGTPSRTPAVY